MKHTLLSTIAILGLSTMGALAQTYDPAAGSALTDGESGTAYSQTISVDVPSPVVVTGQEIIDALPTGTPSQVTDAINPNDPYELTGGSVALDISGLPAGLSSDCNSCSVAAGASRDIVISGTPSEDGSFTVDITSETSGSVNLGGFDVPFGGSLDLGIPGVPAIPVPTISGAGDALGYTLLIAADPNGIAESNEVFSLNLFPNPTQNVAFLNVNSTIAGVANIEVFSITGALVQSSSSAIRVGANRVTLDLESVPTGIYLVKADINGTPALIRMQKI